jgi:Ca2+-binding EF-hand superfamily protein
MRFCRSEASESSQLIAPRFRGMDLNEDGVITRREWRGNTVAFNNQDTNDDGVLSGEEVRAGGRAGRRASDYDFDALDGNRNNRIERREWQARLDQFNRLDVNADNVLSRAELEGTGDSAVGTTGQFIAVGGDRQWVDTRINVRAGDTVTINADGRIRLSRDTRDFATAAGSTLGRRTEGAAIPSAPRGSLVARIGDGAPVFIGDNRTLRAPRAGRLYLGVNDDYFDDNTGQYNVTVDVN